MKYAIKYRYHFWDKTIYRYLSYNDGHFDGKTSAEYSSLKDIRQKIIQYNFIFNKKEYIYQVISE